MKTKGSRFEYREERDADLLRAYKDLVVRDSMSIVEIAQRIAGSQSRRFWCSEARATTVVLDMMKGRPIESMIETRQRMYKEIYRRTMRLREQNPGTPVRELVYRVCNEPAPEFYLTWKSVIVILNRVRREDACRRKRHLITRNYAFLHSRH